MSDGKPVVRLDSKKFEAVHKKYGSMVVGGFVGKRLPFQYVKEAIKQTWRLKNEFVMKPYGDWMFSFEFGTEEDRLKVLEIGCIHIASQWFVVRPWQLFFEADLEDMKTIPI